MILGELILVIALVTIVINAIIFKLKRGNPFNYDGYETNWSVFTNVSTLSLLGFIIAAIIAYFIVNWTYVIF